MQCQVVLFALRYLPFQVSQRGPMIAPGRQLEASRLISSQLQLLQMLLLLLALAATDRQSNLSVIRSGESSIAGVEHWTTKVK